MMFQALAMELVLTPLLIMGVLVFGVLLILALISAPVDGREPSGAHLRTPRETLDEHLTKGEISREEYVDRRRALDFKTAII
jgi:uncharacterized membrane protein